MGTRSLTIFSDEDGREIAVMYRQFDGYLDGHGRELATFLRDRYLTNGYSMDDVGTGKCANGMGDLVAQVICQFKLDNRLGGIYVYPAGTRDIGEEFVYFVRPSRSWNGEGHGRIVVTAEWKDGTRDHRKVLCGWPNHDHRGAQ
jgi:hypothetical protein